VGCEDLGREAPPGALDPDAGSPQSDGLRLELRVRERYPLGAEAWAELRVVAPEPGEARLRTRSLVAVVDGQALPARPWPMEWPLRRAEPRRLELGTLAGSAIDQEGAHTLALRFQAELIGESTEAGRSTWRGELASPTVSFERAAMRPGELVRPEPSPSPDPADLLEISLHLGGRPLVVWPRSASPRELLLTVRPDHASLWVSCRAACLVDLAFDVLADTGADPVRVGTLAAEGRGLGPEPAPAGELDLSRLPPSPEGLRLDLRLVPSALVAQRHPGILGYWDRRLELTPVRLPAPAPVPEGGGPGIP